MTIKFEYHNTFTILVILYNNDNKIWNFKKITSHLAKSFKKPSFKVLKFMDHRLHLSLSTSWFSPSHDHCVWSLFDIEKRLIPSSIMLLIYNFLYIHTVATTITIIGWNTRSSSTTVTSFSNNPLHIIIHIITSNASKAFNVHKSMREE
jgi:hypothetical protein